MKFIKFVKYIIDIGIIVFIIYAMINDIDIKITSSSFHEIFSENSNHFTVTQDTNVSRVKGLSKYVTQEEVDSFAFRYWDIDSNYTLDIPSNLIPLREYLKQKDTNKVINYIKDNNLSIDVKIQDATTPLMYSSFYNDLNTSKILIKLGANIRIKDKYGLSPLAYAIENNSTLTAKLLMDNGVRFNELGYVQSYLNNLQYAKIDKLIIDNDKIDIVFSKEAYQKSTHGLDGQMAFNYIVARNFIELAKMALEDGYKPTLNRAYGRLHGIDRMDDNATNIRLSVYDYLGTYPNYEPMLELLLKYDVIGKPSEELLKFAYDTCHYDYEWFEEIWTKDMARPFYIDMAIKHYEKYCSHKDKTFSIRDFFAWSNNEEMLNNIKDIGNYSKSKIIYLDNNNEIRVINKINFWLNKI